MCVFDCTMYNKDFISLQCRLCSLLFCWLKYTHFIVNISSEKKRKHTKRIRDKCIQYRMALYMVREMIGIRFFVLYSIFSFSFFSSSFAPSSLFLVLFFVFVAFFVCFHRYEYTVTRHVKPLYRRYQRILFYILMYNGLPTAFLCMPFAVNIKFNKVLRSNDSAQTPNMLCVFLFVYNIKKKNSSFQYY